MSDGRAWPAQSYSSAFQSLSSEAQNIWTYLQTGPNGNLSRKIVCGFSFMRRVGKTQLCASGVSLSAKAVCGSKCFSLNWCSNCSNSQLCNVVWIKMVQLKLIKLLKQSTVQCTVDQNAAAEAQLRPSDTHALLCIFCCKFIQLRPAKCYLHINIVCMHVGFAQRKHSFVDAFRCYNSASTFPPSPAPTVLFKGWYDTQAVRPAWNIKYMPS